MPPSPTIEDLAHRVGAIEEQMKSVATKDDIAEVLKFLKSVNVGIGVVRFTWNNIGKIGTMLLMAYGGWIFFKYGAMAVISWATANNLP